MQWEGERGVWWSALLQSTLGPAEVKAQRGLIPEVGTSAFPKVLLFA